MLKLCVLVARHGIAGLVALSCGRANMVMVLVRVVAASHESPPRPLLQEDDAADHGVLSSAHASIRHAQRLGSH